MTKMITETQFQEAKNTILKAIFIDKMNYSQVVELVRNKHNLDYEMIAYRMDEEGVF